jgi:hypothetical protein
VIACALCVGADDEPYLEAALASIAPVVDLLVVNDNSGLAQSANVTVIERSAFAATGRLRVFRHTFGGFDAMRNDAFADLCSIARPDWVLFLDADEVHGEQIASIASEVLPKLGPPVGQLDAYTYHFWGTFGWISDIARRMMFYRFAPDLRWENAVHEKLTNVPGKAVVLPYIYHHYGNVLPPSRLAVKHRRYFAYGNAVPEPPSPERATVDMYAQRARAVRPFSGTHPLAARALVRRLNLENAELFADIDRRIAGGRTPISRLRSVVAGANEGARAWLRAAEHPGLYRGPLVAR